MLELQIMKNMLVFLVIVEMLRLKFLYIIKIKIRDTGCGIENVEKAMEPLFTTCPEGERAGLGFAVMESFTDRLKVTSHVGKGTCVIMQKKLCVRKMGNEQTDR